MMHQVSRAVTDEPLLLILLVLLALTALLMQYADRCSCAVALTEVPLSSIVLTLDSLLYVCLICLPSRFSRALKITRTTEVRPNP